MGRLRRWNWALLAVVVLAPRTDGAEPLKSPFAAQAGKPPASAPPAFTACPKPPAPLFDLNGVSYYTDKAHSIVDVELEKKNERAFIAVRRYTAQAISLSESYYGGRPPDPAAARCALDWFDAWASGGALLGAVNRQGVYERDWTTSALALAYLKFFQAPGLDPVKRDRVAGWLKAVAERITPGYEDLERDRNRANHAYWAGVAVAATGVAADDRALFDWGVARGRLGLAQIAEDGTLPLEMKRGVRALHYHAFALSPLVMIAELGAANGLDLYAERGGALHRLVGKTLGGMEDPAPFEKAAGVKQEELRPDQYAWAEPYYARFRQARLLPLIEKRRPLRDPRLGGDLTLAFGAAEAARPRN